MEKQIRDILEFPFASEMIKQREGSYGRVLDYVEGWAVIQRLNEAFGGDWDFEVKAYETLEEEVVVLGKISANGIVKCQFGSSAITRAKETGKPISIGDDFKSAATDALKKCASLLGVALYLYNGGSNASTVAINTLPVESVEKPIYCSAGSGLLPGGSTIDVQQEAADNPQTNGDSRLSHKQLNYLINLGRKVNWSFKELNEESRKIYCVDVDHLSRKEASDFISILKAKANN